MHLDIVVKSHFTTKDFLSASAEFKPLNMTLSEHQRQAMGLDWMKWKVSSILFPAFMSKFVVSKLCEKFSMLNLKHVNFLHYLNLK